MTETNLTVPSVVLVHAAWADASSWNKVVTPLQRKGMQVVAVQIPLSSLSDDAVTVRRTLKRVSGPVVLVGHSYGGAVIRRYQKSFRTRGRPCDHTIVEMLPMAAFRFLKGHPLAMQADFEEVLVLTYALPEATLRPMMPPGLVVDTYENYGFLAIAMVQTRNMRPRFVPRLIGRDFFLTGYRIFTRYRTPSGRVLRGLRILRSDTDSDFLARWGNRLTHYQYRKAHVSYCIDDRLLEVEIHTHSGEADLHVRAHLANEPAPLPPGSPFPNLQVARKFAGPLPFTFDYEAETDSIIRVQGVRHVWEPKTTRVEVLQNTFIEKEPFASAPPILASAFRLANVPYRWKRGVREAVTVE